MRPPCADASTKLFSAAAFFALSLLYSFLYYSSLAPCVCAARLFLPLRVQKRRAVLFLLSLAPQRSALLSRKHPARYGGGPYFTRVSYHPAIFLLFLKQIQQRYPTPHTARKNTRCEQKRGRKNEECTQRDSHSVSLSAAALALITNVHVGNSEMMYVYFYEKSHYASISFISHVSPRRASGDD